MGQSMTLVDEIVERGLVKCTICGAPLVKDKFAEDKYGPHWVLRCPNADAHPETTYIPPEVSG